MVSHATFDSYIAMLRIFKKLSYLLIVTIFNYLARMVHCLLFYKHFRPILEQ